MLDFAHRYDLFSQPFNFMIGQQGKKSTIFGGFLSLSIISISITYFAYLLYNFFSYKNYPNVSNSIKINNELEMDLAKNFLMFQVLINGIPIQQYEAQQNKKYITQKLIFQQYSDTDQIQKNIHFEDCDEPDFPNLSCISSQEETNITYLKSSTRESGYYILLFGKCINEVGVQDDCASEQEIDELFSTVNNFFSLYVQIKQYNSLERKFEVGFKQEYFYIDPEYVTYTTITLKKAHSFVTEGLIIQQTEEVESVFDYTRFDSIYKNDKENTYDMPGFKQLISVSFHLDQISNSIIIQHVQFTQVLSQFMSAMNSLLVVGIFARFVASKNIYKDFLGILLSDSYKQQAYDIIAYSQLNIKLSSDNILEEKSDDFPNKKKKQSFNKGVEKKILFDSESEIQRNNHQTSIITNSNQNSIEKKNKTQSIQITQSQTQIINKQPHISKENRYNNTFTLPKQKQQQQHSNVQAQQLQQNQPQISKETNKFSSSQQYKSEKYSTEYDNSNIFLKICHKENQIQGNKLSLSMKSILNIPQTQKIKQLVCSIFCCRRCKKNQNEDENKYKQLKYLKGIYGKIEEEMRNTLNIYSIFQDLIQIKMAIKLLFTEDQYAALHFCTNLIINDSDSLKRYIYQNLSMNQEIGQIIKEENTIKSDKLNSLSPKYQIQENEVERNQNIYRNKQNIVQFDERSMKSDIPQKYFDSQQTIYQKKFIGNYKNLITNTQSGENQEVQNRLNCEIIGDNEGNIQNESLEEVIMNENTDNKEANNYSILQSKNNTFKFSSLQADDTNNLQISQKNNLKVNFNVQQPQNELINNLYNNLQVKELIDKDISIRKIYLNKFIERNTEQMNNNNNTLTIIDANIFNSLLK